MVRVRITCQANWAVWAFDDRTDVHAAYTRRSRPSYRLSKAATPDRRREMHRRVSQRRLRRRLPAPILPFAIFPLSFCLSFCKLLWVAKVLFFPGRLHQIRIAIPTNAPRILAFVRLWSYSTNRQDRSTRLRSCRRTYQRRCNY